MINMLLIYSIKLSLFVKLDDLLKHLMIFKLSLIEKKSKENYENFVIKLQYLLEFDQCFFLNGK